MIDDYDAEFYDDEEELARRTFAEQIDEATTLSYKERLIGFGVCFIIGWVVSMASISGVMTIVTNPSRFAILYTIGNIVSLCSTMFLYGPFEQIKTMFHPTRRVATWTYIFCIVATLIAARSGQTLIVFLLMFLQFCAMVWYCSSFIPWGRKILRRVLSACFACSFGRAAEAFAPGPGSSTQMRSVDDEIMDV